MATSKQEQLLSADWGWERYSELGEDTGKPTDSFITRYQPKYRSRNNKHAAFLNSRVNIRTTRLDMDISDSLVLNLIAQAEENNYSYSIGMETNLTLSATTPTPYETLIQQATADGWRFTESAQPAFSLEKELYRHISLGTNRWQGERGIMVVFPQILLFHDDPAPHLEELLTMANKAKADFPDSVPYQNTHGEIKEDLFKTKLFRKYRYEA